MNDLTVRRILANNELMRLNIYILSLKCLKKLFPLFSKNKKRTRTCWAHMTWMHRGMMSLHWP